MNHPLLFSTEPLDWTQPVQCTFRQARDVLQLAERKGFKPARIQCVTGGYLFTFAAVAPSAETDAPRGQQQATAGYQAGEGQTSFDAAANGLPFR